MVRGDNYLWNSAFDIFVLYGIPLFPCALSLAFETKKTYPGSRNNVSWVQSKHQSACNVGREDTVIKSAQLHERQNVFV